jgi:hypothetical protein
MWIIRAAFGFFLATWLLYPKEVGDWLRKHKPDLRQEQCVNNVPPSLAAHLRTCAHSDH